MEKELKISVENAMNAYEGADENGKRMLEALLGKDVFKPQDIKERVKTFEDACKALGDEHPFVLLYDVFTNEIATNESRNDDKDVLAYLKLRIIAAALNEGWEPQFKEGEYRYYPWYWLYTKDEYERLSESKKKNCVFLGGGASNDAGAGFVASSTADGLAGTSASFGSRLCFKTRELAEYCGKQFIDIWLEFLVGKEVRHE